MIARNELTPPRPRRTVVHAPMQNRLPDSPTGPCEGRRSVVDRPLPLAPDARLRARDRPVPANSGQPRGHTFSIDVDVANSPPQPRSIRLVTLPERH